MTVSGRAGRGSSMEPAEAVHVVDDDAAVRDSIQFILESNGWRTLSYPNAAAFLEAPLPSVGCVVSDFHMPGMNGLQLQGQLAQRGLRLPVIIMTGQGDVPIAVRALKAGAVDFLEKPFRDDELLVAVSEAVAVSRRAVEADTAAEKAALRIASLTPREHEVLDLLVLGQSNKEMARALGISPRTIDVHRARVLEKLDVATLPDLVRLVMAARPADGQAPTRAA
jgi:two-component system response regulator FixJ